MTGRELGARAPSTTVCNPTLRIAVIETSVGIARARLLFHSVTQGSIASVSFGSHALEHRHCAIGVVIDVHFALTLTVQPANVLG
jgi:hypothetical protein